MEYDFGDIAKNLINDKKKNIDIYKREIEKVKESLSEYALKIDDLQTAYDYFAIKKSLLVVDDKILSGKYSYIIDGWIPKEKAQDTINELNKSYMCDIQLREP